MSESQTYTPSTTWWPTPPCYEPIDPCECCPYRTSCKKSKKPCYVPIIVPPPPYIPPYYPPIIWYSTTSAPPLPGTLTS